MFVWMGNLLVNTDRITFVRVAGDVAEVFFGGSEVVQLDVEAVRPVLGALAVDMTPEDPESEDLALSDLQIPVVLEAYRHGLFWLTQDDVGFAFAHEKVPEKSGGYWESSGARVRLKSLDRSALLDMDKPIFAEDLLRKAGALC